MFLVRLRVCVHPLNLAALPLFSLVGSCNPMSHPPASLLVHPRYRPSPLLSGDRMMSFSAFLNRGVLSFVDIDITSCFKFPLIHYFLLVLVRP